MYQNALKRVQEDGFALKRIKNQTHELCMAAVQQNGYSLKFVKEQTPEICMAAVQGCGPALKYVKEQTFDLCVASLREIEDEEFARIYILRYIDEDIAARLMETFEVTDNQGRDMAGIVPYKGKEYSVYVTLDSFYTFGQQIVMQVLEQYEEECFSYYINKYKELWDQCLIEAGANNADDVTAGADTLFNEIATAEDVAGYYLFWYKRAALKMWNENLLYSKRKSGVNDCEKEVSNILEGLFRN